MPCKFKVSSLVAPYDMGNLVCINLQYSVLPNQLEKQWHQPFTVLLQTPVGMHLVTSEVETV